MLPSYFTVSLLLVARAPVSSPAAVNRDAMVQFGAEPNWSWSVNLTKIRFNTEPECNHPSTLQTVPKCERTCYRVCDLGPSVRLSEPNHGIPAPQSSCLIFPPS